VNGTLKHGSCWGTNPTGRLWHKQKDMFATSSVRTVLTATIVVAVAFWAIPALGQNGPHDPPGWWGDPNDPMTESREYGFESGTWPPQPDNPPNQHGGVEPDWTCSDPDNVEVDDNGDLKIGPNSTLEIKFHNFRVEENTKEIWIQYEYMFTGAIKGMELVLPDKTKVRRKTKDSEDKHHDGNWHLRTIGYQLDPQPEWEAIRFTTYTGCMWIRNLKFGSHCMKKWWCDGSGEGYFFDIPGWPPESGYSDLPDGYDYTQWARDGSYPPEWMPAVTDHEGVIGMPGGGGAPAEGVLTARLDSIEEPQGVRHCCYQFDFYAAEGGGVFWEELLPPGTTVEDRQDGVEELFDGWQRATITFDATPPPDWVEFHWYMVADPAGGPVAIDNLIMSSAAGEDESPPPPSQQGAGGLLAPTSVMALVPGQRWSDNFDSYENETGMHGQGGWKGWDNDPSFDAFVSDVQSHSAPHSVDIAADADLLHELDEFTLGKWTFTAWQYIPSDFSSGGGTPFPPGTYLLLLNTYNDGGPYNWSVQMVFDSNDGMLKVSYGNGHDTIDVPYVTDRWVKIQIDIDLDNDWTHVYYDDIRFEPYSWTGGIYGEGGGAPDVRAVDLFANGSTSVYYDDFSLRAVLGP